MENDPIVIVVTNVTDKQIVDLFLLPRPGPFFFALPTGKYQLAAFVDRNRDLSYEPEKDPAVLVTDLELKAGERRTGLDLVIDPGSTVRVPFAVKAFSPERDGGILSGEANDGTVTVSSELAMPIQRQAF